MCYVLNYPFQYPRNYSLLSHGKAVTTRVDAIWAKNHYGFIFLLDHQRLYFLPQATRYLFEFSEHPILLKVLPILRAWPVGLLQPYAGNVWSIPSRPDPAPLDLIPYPALYQVRSRYIQTLSCSLDQLRSVTRSSIYYNKLQRLFQQKETKLAVNKISGMRYFFFEEALIQDTFKKFRWPRGKAMMHEPLLDVH